MSLRSRRTSNRCRSPHNRPATVASPVIGGIRRVGRGTSKHRKCCELAHAGTGKLRHPRIRKHQHRSPPPVLSTPRPLRSPGQPDRGRAEWKVAPLQAMLRCVGRAPGSSRLRCGHLGVAMCGRCIVACENSSLPRWPSRDSCRTGPGSLVTDLNPQRGGARPGRWRRFGPVSLR